MAYLPLKSLHILIVDDQEANIDVLEGFLAIQGYTIVKSTADPREVLALLDSFRPDLILLDLMMPHMSGFEVLEQLKQHQAETSYLPVLVLTADITPEAKQRALAAGARDFLSKPFDLVEVGLRISNLLETRSLYLQLGQQNQLLEEKVRERTAALEQTNSELAAALVKAEASDRLKTAFMQNISHEVRTPLNGILNFGNLLANPEIAETEKQKFIPLLQASSNRLMNTITDYMDISLIASGNLDVSHAQVDVHEELQSLSSGVEELCRAKGLSFGLELPESATTPLLETDPELFRKIISHLLDNALKFTHHGGITLGYTWQHGKIEIFVKDTGVGITAEVQDQMFQNFRQQDTAITRGYEGSGLGLSIVKGLSDLLGGEIRLMSEAGKGTTAVFSLAFPAANQSVVTESIAQNTKAPADKKPVILIVDDDDINRFCLEYTVQEFADTIYQASDGSEAVETFRQNPDISLILMDMKMPVMDGLEATRQIRRFNTDVVIVAQTAFVHAGVRAEAMAAGCNDYIAKPIEADVLHALIGKHL